MKHLSITNIFLCCLLIVGTNSFGQEGQSKAALAERARREFSERKYAAAERDFRELTRLDPSNIYAYMFLGQCLFSQEKYVEAVDPYEKARALEKKQKVFSTTQKRILTDQLAMTYGMTAQVEKARVLLEEAVRQDPDYPLNYYNLACVFAESVGWRRHRSVMSALTAHWSCCCKDINAAKDRKQIDVQLPLWVSNVHVR